ncbi:hypothetical protein HY522_02020 [bacterium]|nr:hypothetical protein [bacterium]
MPAVLMGDPTGFSVKAGPNPHTRTRWGFLKEVDRAVAIRQWTAFKSLLELAGVRVEVIDADPSLPGLVYPANAGILRDRVFYPANLLPARAAERPVYEAMFRSLGLDVRETAFRSTPFEGEADFFPWGDRFIFTHGRIERQRFALSARFPFYKRIYGFRSDRAALKELQEIVPGREIVDLELRDERYYHGDTCLCSFGLNREFLMAYLPALTAPAQQKLRSLAGDRLIALSENDAAIYAANAFASSLNGRPNLFMTIAASASLKTRVAELGVKVMDVEVSEFLKKGGGSVKCMVFDLG